MTTAILQPGDESATLGGVALKLSELQFRQIVALAHRFAGICVPEARRSMVEGRLGKRVRALRLAGFSEYLAGLSGALGAGGELDEFVDAMTVNKTDFFREPAHFDYLTREVVPKLEHESGAGSTRPLRIWSAACSTGEEPYTLAMICAHTGIARGQQYQVEVLASDVSTRVLSKAETAVYTASDMAPVPPEYRTRYFLRSKDPKRRVYRVAPEIRSRVRFAALNLVSGALDVGDPMDVIFCRNVLIYFDRATQETVLRRLRGRLRPGGYLFTGHAETLTGMSLRLEAVAPTVYRRAE
jgi:chemotaxis protein methyltransferase CheR